MSVELVRELIDALLRAKDDPDTRVVVISGAGEEAFSIGGDLTGEHLPPASPLEHYESEDGYTEIFRILAGLGKPVIAKVDGFCLSTGFGLALGCDLIVASNDSTFGTPEMNRGLVPMRVMAVLIRNCGHKKAMELILTGERISALEAARIGLINHAVPNEGLDTKVESLAKSLAAKSATAMRLGRDAFYTMADLEFENALTYLQAMWTLNLSTEDAREGIAAFREKRPPTWTDR
jgi:enoyl-CoA hydratase/carnithine racemase